jgi:hypothetical protein
VWRVGGGAKDPSEAGGWSLGRGEGAMAVPVLLGAELRMADLSFLLEMPALWHTVLRVVAMVSGEKWWALGAWRVKAWVSSAAAARERLLSGDSGEGRRSWGESGRGCAAMGRGEWVRLALWSGGGE